MNFIEWNDSFSVSVDEFDDQHKKLIEIINKLHNAMKDRKSQEVMSSVFLELANYTKNHFEAEEKWMASKNYPYLMNHKKEHQKLISEVETLFNDFTAGKLLLGLKTMNFLKEWLNNHILNTDKKYSEYK